MYLYVSVIYPYTPYTPYTTYIIPILEPYIHILPYTLYMTDIYVSICFFLCITKKSVKNKYKNLEKLCDG